MRLCDTCGEPTTEFGWGAKGRGTRVPRCQPCRIATKACAILHRAPAPHDEADLERRLVAVRREKADILAGRPTDFWGAPPWRLRDLNRQIDNLEVAIGHARAWTLTQMAETIADDPEFIRRLLEMTEIQS